MKRNSGLLMAMALIIVLLLSAGALCAQPTDEGDIVYTNDRLGFSLTLPASWADRYIAWENPDAVSFLHAQSNKALGGPYGELFTIIRFDGVLTPEQILEGSGMRLLAAQTEQHTYVLSGPSGVAYTDESEAGYLEMRKDIETILATVKAIPLIPADGIQVIVDGKRLAFDVPPQNVNNRVLVPLRAIFEEMGAEIDYDQATQTVTAAKGDTVVVLTIGDSSPTINGKVVPLDQPGIIIGGRTLAPLRFVAEAFGGAVEWIGDKQTAAILTKAISEPHDYAVLLADYFKEDPEAAGHVFEGTNAVMMDLDGDGIDEVVAAKYVWHAEYGYQQLQFVVLGVIGGKGILIEPPGQMTLTEAIYINKDKEIITISQTDSEFILIYNYMNGFLSA
ncbi:MAG: copper amine oxidase N-terminal domain-containing protein, partial [Clostridiales bacterium]|nr:copper amine oxidase N-terminal domain-containing protein [Clostridiales bacterium]